MPKPQFSRFSKSRKESKSLPIVWIFVVVTVLFSFSDSITTLNISQYVPDTVGGVAMTSVMSSDNNRTTTSSTTTTKLRQSTQPTVGKFTWIDTEQPMLPLVSNFSGDINQFTNESIFYDPSIGYSFPCNGQNGRTDNIFYSHDKLRKQLLPGRVFTADQAIQCLSGASGGASALWIHIDGDSLARDMYYDLTEFFGMGWNAKKKTLEQQSFTAAAEFSFRGDTTTRHTRPTWMDMEQFEKRQGCPNVWIYESGLWDHPAKTSNETYRDRTQALTNFNHSCVTHKILRYTSPYQGGRNYNDQENYRTRGFNEIATSILSPVGFVPLDVYSIFEHRADWTHDNVHYTGPGSKWVTNALLNMICE